MFQLTVRKREKRRLMISELSLLDDERLAHNFPNDFNKILFWSTKAIFTPESGWSEWMDGWERGEQVESGSRLRLDVERRPQKCQPSVLIKISKSLNEFIFALNWLLIDMLRSPHTSTDKANPNKCFGSCQTDGRKSTAAQSPINNPNPQKDLKIKVRRAKNNPALGFDILSEVRKRARRRKWRKMKIAVREQIKFNIKNKLARTVHFSALFSTLSVDLKNGQRWWRCCRFSGCEIHALCILHKDERHYAVTLIKM